MATKSARRHIIPLTFLMIGKSLGPYRTPAGALARSSGSEIRMAVIVSAVPAAVNAVMRRCLEKDPRERFQSARDLSFALQAVATETRSGVTPVTAPARNRLVPAVAAVLGVCTVAAVGLVVWGRPQPASNPATRMAASIISPPDVRVEGTPAIAPDGRTVAFVGSGGGATARIFVRSLDTFETRAIAGTEGAEGPFWSPDSRSLGFFARGRLWRVIHSRPGRPSPSLRSIRGSSLPSSCGCPTTLRTRLSGIASS
jgi:hypothetical protein